MPPFSLKTYLPEIISRKFNHARCNGTDHESLYGMRKYRQYYFSVVKPRVRKKTNLITQPISNFGFSIHIKLN